LFIKRLKSAYFLNNKQFNDALLLWADSKKGNPDANKRIMSILKLKYGNDLKKNVSISEVINSDSGKKVILKIDDEIIKLMYVFIDNRHCNQKVKKCLYEIDYLKGVF
jgi:hypothetical protein